MRTHLSTKSLALCSLLFLLLCLGVDITVPRAAEVIEKVGEGRILWTSSLVTAQGIGAPPKGIKNPAQSRALAQRAAISIARRNLWEVLKGVRIDSATTTENLIVSSDAIKTEISGILQGSQVMQIKYLPDGSVEVTVGVSLKGELASALMPRFLFSVAPSPSPAAPAGEAAGGIPAPPAPVSMERAAPAVSGASGESMPVPVLPGELRTPATGGKGEERGEAESKLAGTAPPPGGQSAEGHGAGTRKTEAAPPAPQQVSDANRTAAPFPSPTGSSPPSPQQMGGEKKDQKAVSPVPKRTPQPKPSVWVFPVFATGLVVDARGIGLKPALLPRILDERGGEIYSSRQVSRLGALEQGFVGYDRDVSAAQRNVRVADQPLLVRGIGVVGKERTDVVLSDGDAAVVAAAAASNFLGRLRVIIVYD